MSYMEDRAARKNGLLPKLEFKKPKKPIPKQSEKKKKELAEQKDAKGDGGLDAWFVAKRKEMVGRCLFCNQKTEKENNETYRRSIAHLLPKNKKSFASVATHPDNFIELCHFNNSCHSNFDSGKITWEFLKDSKEWDVIKEKLLNILPMVAPEEQKHKLYSKLITLVYGKDNYKQQK